MTRIFSCFLILFFFTEFATAQIDPASKFYLLGKVKTITENSYVGLASGKEYVKGPKGWPYSWLTDSKTELDSNGNIVKIVYLDNLAKPIRTDEFKFENGKLTLSQTADKDQAFEYDSLGRISREIIIRRKKSDKPNDLNRTSIESTRIIYTYDAKNRVKQKLEYDVSDQLAATETFYYDSLNNLILQKGIRGNEKDSIVYSYNLQNQLIRLEWFDEADKLKDRTFFEYANKFVVHQKWEDFDDGILDGTVEYKYENGNEKEILDIEADGTFAGKETYSYIFDKTGNWIRKVTIIDNEEIFILERKIEYYVKK